MIVEAHRPNPIMEQTTHTLSKLSAGRSHVACTMPNINSIALQQENILSTHQHML